MTKKAIETAAKAFKENPSRYLSGLPRTFGFSGAAATNLARILNAAGFYCRTLDTNHWRAVTASRLVALRDDPGLCSELAAISPKAKMSPAYSVFFFATDKAPHRGLPGQFPCFLDASRAAIAAAPGAAVSSFGGPRYAIFSSADPESARIGEIIADHELVAQEAF